VLDSQESNYRFHKAIQDAYVATNAWLSGMRDISGYKVLKYDEVTSMLREKTLLSAATQFHTFFPAHFFKVACTLEQVITGPRLVEWLGHNPRVCLVDVGCGAGAASAAFVDIILRLQEAGRIKNSIQVCCIGIDPNPYAIALYATFLKELRNRLPLSRLDLVCKIKPSGIPSATSWIIQLLDQRRSDWKLPNIPHVMIMQVNIVSPLDKDHTDQEASYRILAGLGIEASDTTTAHSEFGVEQALAYKSILEGVGVDHMHVVTIGTDDYLLGERVEEMGAALQRVLDDGLHQTRLIGGQYQVKFYNPVGSRFQWNTDLVDRQFYANVISVTSRDWQGDTDWHEVVSLENLRLAWARARYALLRESFTDELEIRLFESNLDESLERMRYQLMAYAEHVASRDDHVAYKVPKSQTSVRPRGLSPIEEELLSVAVVQKLGHRESRLRQCSYAYRIAQKSAGRDTEYLYEYWLSAYKKFLEDAREQAKKYENCAVLRTDIKSFYTRIEQDKLVRLTVQALTENRSQRIEWLIRMLLSRDLDDHEVGRGIVQGNIGSGFYANIYLTAVDILFGANNGWGLKFFRYVDDMIFIIPEPEALCANMSWASAW
jgi:SAM-dependent methyltransferase